MVRIMSVIGNAISYPSLASRSLFDLMNLMNFAKCQTVVIRLAMQAKFLSYAK